MTLCLTHIADEIPIKLTATKKKLEFH